MAKSIFLLMMVLILVGCQTIGSPRHAVNVKYENIKWEMILPDFGAGSPEIAVLRVDPKSEATELMIRIPKNFHVTRHWHSANETHTVMSGTFIVEAEGKREELGPGSFNYIPSGMIHQAWTRPDEGAVLFVTVDGKWDANFIEGPPRPITE